VTKPGRAYGATHDPRFILHQRQPRANKLDARQRVICKADPAYAEALRQRVSHEARFSAFIANAPFYVDVEALCPRCGGYKRRTRDRSCYQCHLARSGANFERIKAGLTPVVQRTRDSYLDLKARERAERNDEYDARRFGDLSAKWWPTGKLEVTFPEGYVEPDMSKLTWQQCMNALAEYPALRDVFRWAGWPVD
jgi:hypothetical protein